MNFVVPEERREWMGRMIVSVISLHENVSERLLSVGTGGWEHRTYIKEN